MLLIAAAFMTIFGVLCGYVAVGLARTQEREAGYVECEKRLEILRRQLRYRTR